MFSRDFGVFRVRLQRDQSTFGRQRPREQDRAVTAESADLQDIARPLNSGQQLEQFALVRRDFDRRQPGRAASLQRRVESRVGRREQIVDVVVNGGPSFPRHGSSFQRCRASSP